MQHRLGQYGALLVAYLRPQSVRVALLAALLLGSIGLQVFNPQVLRAFIDAATTVGTAHASLVMAAGLFMGLALLQQVLAVTATYVGETVGWTATNALRADLALHCLRLDLGFHSGLSPTGPC